MVEAHDEAFGPLLRRLRDRAGLTQEELAERAGLTSHAVSALERGTRTRPYPHTVRALATALEADDAERAALLAAVPRSRTGRDAAPADPAPERPAALVIPPTRLHGRERDVAVVTGLVRNGSRLVTLTGPGGVGKTRLVAAAAERLAPEHPDGLVTVSLAPLTDADAVLPTLTRALGLAGGDAVELRTVLEHLADRRALLVLDNFEHLLSGATVVGEVVAGCPGVTVLVTSRSPLRLRGEREHAVEPLALPARDVTTIDGLDATPAGALLLDRARAIDAPLTGSVADVQALTELCHRLAGLPLAIELASAQLRVLSPRSLLDRLDVVTATSGARDLPERQRTMRSTLDWSYDLLGPDDQRLFRLLGVFRGGAGLDAVEHVAGDVTDALGRLVEHSLVVVTPGPDGEVRYHLLEPVRQYARSLMVGAEAADAEAAHADWFRALAERAAAGYERAEQVAWLERTEVEEANLLVAVDRCLDRGDAATAARICWSLWLYWWLRGQFTVGRQCAERCLRADLPSRERSRAHLAAATMSYAGGDAEAAAGHWEQALALGLRDDDPEIGCKGSAGLGLAALAAGDTGTAGGRFRDSLELGVRAGEDGVWMRSLVHVWLGTVLLLGQDAEAAVVEIGRGLALARERGDRLSTYVGLYNLAQVAIGTGDRTTARHHVDEGIRLSGETGDRSNLAYFLESLAVVEDRPERVAVLLGAADALRRSVGADVYAYYLPDASLRVAAEESARGDLGEAAYEHARDTGAGLDLATAVDFALSPR